jgi:hypothetical protein
MGPSSETLYRIDMARSLLGGGSGLALRSVLLLSSGARRVAARPGGRMGLIETFGRRDGSHKARALDAEAGLGSHGHRGRRPKAST